MHVDDQTKSLNEAIVMPLISIIVSDGRHNDKSQETFGLVTIVGAFAKTLYTCFSYVYSCDAGVIYKS